MILKGKAPVRISFAGGGTDIQPYPDLYGGVALNVTINKYVYASLKDRKDNKIVLISGNEDKKEEYSSVEEIKLTGDMLPLKAVTKKYYKKMKGIEVYLYSEVPIRSGLGGSAAVFLLLISLFNRYNESMKRDQYEIAEEAYRFEREDLGIHGGMQDQYAIAFGGLNYLEFFKDNFVKVNKVLLNENISNELDTNLLLFHLGERGVSGDVIADQNKNLKNKKETLEAMHEMKKLAKEMELKLINGDLGGFGKNLNDAWEIKKKFSSKISNPKIDEVYSEFMKLGALGGKITGAGGGGHMIIYAPLECHRRIMQKAKTMGLMNVPFNFEKDGICLWEVNE